MWIPSVLPPTKSAAHVGRTVARVCVFERWAAGCISLCIRKVLQLLSRSRFTLIFLGPRTNSALVTSIHITLHASRGCLPTATFRPNAALSAVSKFCHNEPSKYKIQQNSKPNLNARILFLYSILKQPISHHPAFFTSQQFTLPADTFTRRTSGHSLATFVAVHSVLPTTTTTMLLSATPSLFSFVFYIKKINWASVFGLLHIGFLSNFPISHRPASGDRGRPVCLVTIAESVHNFKFCFQPLLFAVI